MNGSPATTCSGFSSSATHLCLQWKPKNDFHAVWSFGAKVVFERERCIASVRNTGAKAAAGNIVGFLDADGRITQKQRCH